MRKIKFTKIIKKSLEINCCMCKGKTEYIIGYGQTKDEIKDSIPEKSWNGWYIGDDIELCPLCMPAGLILDHLIEDKAKEGKQACKKKKQIEDCPYHKDAIHYRSSWLRGFLIEKYKTKRR